MPRAYGVRNSNDVYHQRSVKHRSNAQTHNNTTYLERNTLHASYAGIRIRKPPASVTEETEKEEGKVMRYWE